ncbi:ER lumen protein retaining receptor-domain-containing protein [Boletus reticuloceps]|uniref:ER lumen protein retaining receptor-domain-containing protein n=1 Tax=Boletus reticuloceps TaxID=495285 RepID=A0A8I2Z1W5_9AGAM|nr:ER lumen protein retaining receptor-domain-containing protein [Boletus reticuloceps]
MNIFRLLGDLAHLASIFIIVHKIQTTRSCRGISFKTQALYVLVFLMRYIDLFFQWVSLYNFIMKIFFIASSCYILYLMKNRFRPTHDPSVDTFKIQYLLGPCFLLSLIFNYRFSLTEVLWTFSIYLEAVAIFPQLFMLQRTGEAETITTHYLAALGIYRALYIPNWIYRYVTEDVIDPIAVVAGLVQTGLYLDFFYVYFTNHDLEVNPKSRSIMLSVTRCFAALHFAFSLSLLCTLPSVYAAVDTKVANRTIERVSSLLFFTTRAAVLEFRFPGNALGSVCRYAYAPYPFQTVQLRTHSIHPPYIDEDLQNRWWDFGADAYINTNKHIRLTRAVPSQMGWLWSRLPLSSTNYVIEIEFKVRLSLSLSVRHIDSCSYPRAQVSGASGHLYGDGMAIWLTTERTQPGPVFGNKGPSTRISARWPRAHVIPPSADRFEGLGILVDTYANSRHTFGFPRIVAMLGDGQTPYDHEHDGDANSIGSCSANVRRTNVVTKLKLTYVKDSYLDVRDDWSDCFRIDGISLPLSPYLGVSALTGEVFDAHDVISITTHSAVLSSQDAPLNKLTSSGRLFGSRHADGSARGSSWLGWLIKLLFLAGVCVGGAYGYKAYKFRGRHGVLSGLGMDDRRGYGSRRRF